MKKKGLYIVLSVIIISILTFITYSKFKYNSIWDYYFSSKSFYLESDNLSIDNKVNTNNMWDGSAINFVVKNYNNDDLVTSDDIKYEIRCNTNNVDVKCNLNNTKSNIIEDIIKSGDKRDVNLYFTLESNVDYSDIEVNISLKSLSPYQKELKGKYILHKVNDVDNKITYDIVNNKLYSMLNIKNDLENDKCVSVIILNNKIRVLKDNNMFDIALDEEGYINNFSINVSKLSNYGVKLYSANNSTISSDSIMLSECK